MFSDYDPGEHHHKLDADDDQQFSAELMRLLQLHSDFYQSPDLGKFNTLYDRSVFLARELAAYRADYKACRAELEAEKKVNSQLDMGRLYGALLFASLASAFFIATLSTYDPLYISVGILAAIFVSLVLWYFACAILQCLYHAHPNLPDLYDPSDKRALVLTLSAPVVIAAIYQLIHFFAKK